MNYVADVHLSEAQIRDGLIAYLKRTHANDCVVRGELPILNSRIDVVRLSEHRMEGFEIKSDDDKLTRLSGQAADYNQVFDGITLVTGRMLASDAMFMAPRFWGILQARLTTDGEVVFVRCQKCARNPKMTSIGLASMLWRGEAIQCLQAHGSINVPKSWSAARLRELVVAQVTLPLLHQFVARCLANPQRSSQYGLAH